MENYYNHSNTSYDGDSNTYVSGSGFINNRPEKQEEKTIKKASNTLSIAILINYLLTNIISGSLMFMLTAIGVGGYFTGGQFVQFEQAQLFTKLASVFIATVIVIIGIPILLKTKQEFKNSFGKPQTKILLFAVSFSLALSVVGTHMLDTLQKNFDLFGVTIKLPSYDIGSSPISIVLTFLFSVICIPVLEEILYRGIMLGFMRKYSDTFAVVFCSFLPAVLQENLSDAVVTFIFSLLLCYFTIKSQTVITAIVMRVCCGLFVYLKAFVQFFALSNVADISIMLLEIIILMCAVFAFMLYSHKNSRAFCTRSKTIYYNDISKFKFAVKSPVTLILVVIFILKTIF